MDLTADDLVEFFDDTRTQLEKADPRELARSYGWARIGLGAIAFVFPRMIARPWVGGEQAGAPGALVLSRALAGRDMALGLGTVLAVEKGAPVRGWVEAGGLADATDALTTLLHWRSLPISRWFLLGLTAGSAAASQWLARRL